MVIEAQPIAYRVAPESLGPAAISCTEGSPALLTLTRALEGMQKEAIVLDEGTGCCWRLLCDEGPWLNGTDLAPFPLGYFVGGLASCLLEDIHVALAAGDFADQEVHLRLDVFFTMDGSILRGTMAAGVNSMQLVVGSDDEADQAQLRALVDVALERHSGVNRALITHLPGRFRLAVNGEAVDWPGQHAAGLSDTRDPRETFTGIAPASATDLPQPIVCKDTNAPAPSGGGAVGLQSEQKRTVHIAADARLRQDGLQEVGARCVTPAGSRFVFLAANEADDTRAPGGQVYLSAGVAFCFMTQLGRYAQIKKLHLDGYRIVQKTAFGDDPSPVETAVFLDSRDSAENHLKMVQIGEQTCYVHTSMREPVKLTVQAAAFSGGVNV